MDLSFPTTILLISIVCSLYEPLLKTEKVINYPRKTYFQWVNMSVRRMCAVFKNIAKPSTVNGGAFRRLKTFRRSSQNLSTFGHDKMSCKAITQL